MQVMKNDIDEMLECAIREKGLLADMAKLDAAALKHERRRTVTFVCSIAACLIMFIGIDLSLSSIARRVGYGFEPAAGQMGGSEITALMQEKRIDEALEKIGSARVEINARRADPVSDDPEYLTQLSIDNQELDLLEAVCRLRKGQYLRARKSLNVIVNAGGAWSEDADRLLEEL